MNLPGLLAVAAMTLAVVGAARSRRELQRWLGADPLGPLRPLRLALLVLALGALAAAWSDARSTPPRLGGAGADVVLAFDVSRSMDTQDSPPSRLRRGIRLAERFLEGAGGMRVGLVIFAGAAFPVVPLTQDHDAVTTYLTGLDTDLVSRPGTDIAAALRAAAGVFDPASSRPRTVLLVSDGEHGGASLGGELRDLRAGGIRVVTIGFGTPSGGVVPVRLGAALRDERGNTVISRRDDRVLREIASATGGSYHREPEEHPDPHRLLPPPTPVREAPAKRQPARIAIWVMIAAVALGIEIFLSSPARLGLAGAAPLAATAALLLAAGPRGWIEEGDRKLEQGEARPALSLYRRAERTLGTRATTQIRVGNALYRLDTFGLASAAYVEALRRLEPEQDALRFVAAFNLGTALLAQERHDEARDAFWTALMARPDSVEAKFNYEWAVARIPPEPPPETPPTPRPRPEESRAGERPEQTERGPEAGDTTPRPPSGELTKEEAERWLRGVGDDPAGPLRDQIAGRAGSTAGRGEQTW